MNDDFLADLVNKIDRSVIRLEGKVDNLATRVEAGDRQSEQLVELLKPRLDNLTRWVDDLREADKIERVVTSTEISKVRTDVERQLSVHIASEVPHGVLAARITALETAGNRAAGARAVYLFVIPLLVAIVTALLGVVLPLWFG